VPLSFKLEFMKSAADWQKDIERSLEYQKDRNAEAARFMRAYTGDYNATPRKELDYNKDEMYVNFVYSFVETIAPTIFSGDIRGVADAKNPDSEGTAKHIEAVTNYWALELGLRDDFKLCRWDRFFSNTYFLSEWDYEDREVEKENILFVNPLTGEPVIGDPLKETEVIRDQPLAKRLDPRDVILDPDSKSRKEDRWRGYRMVIPYAEFEKMDVSKKSKKDIKPEAMPQEATRLGGDTEQGVNQEWVTLWKIYDLANEKILLLRDRGDCGQDVVDEKDWPFDFEVEGDRFPITVLEAKMDAESPYGFSEFKAFWAQIQERNKIRTTIQSTTRRQRPKYLNKGSVNDEDQINKFTNAKIGEVVNMNNPEALMLAPIHQLPAEVYNFDAMSGDDLINTSGFYEYNQDSIADTATEASLLATRSNIRKAETKQDFERFISRVLAKIAALCQQFMDASVAVKIKNPKNPKDLLWLQASKEDIQGEFNWTFKPGVMAHKDEGLRRQQTLKFAEIMAGNPNVDQRWLAEKLTEAFEFDDSGALRPLEDIEKEKMMAQEAQAAEAKAKAKPPLQFSQIDWTSLPVEIQAQVLDAAMAQNGVNGMGGGSGSAPPAPMAPPAQNNVPGGMEMNQAPPPMAGADMPPPNPISPMSEIQGGTTL
jgi:hypothetical protein